ncbi:hypothetical protein JKG47_18985 [Acidithiobacillus sp. MC6.1]|nr:hypothetical protein [Acidithiobacillus sp. MC6.1]
MEIAIFMLHDTALTTKGIILTVINGKPLRIVHQPPTPSAFEVAGWKNYGTMYLLDFVMCHGDKTAMVRPVWIVQQLEDFPRLVICYVHKSALKVA